jgi:hypothetical protein
MGQWSMLKVSSTVYDDKIETYLRLRAQDLLHPLHLKKIP